MFVCMCVAQCNGPASIQRACTPGGHSWVRQETSPFSTGQRLYKIMYSRHTEALKPWLRGMTPRFKYTKLISSVHMNNLEVKVRCLYDLHLICRDPTHMLLWQSYWFSVRTLMMCRPWCFFLRAAWQKLPLQSTSVTWPQCCSPSWELGSGLVTGKITFSRG